MMTEEMKKEVRELSKKYIEALENIDRQEKAKENYDKALQEKVEEDFMNKKLFLRYNAELTGLTLEFRNIYGIEGGIYEEKKYSGRPFIYPPGTASKDMYDSHLLVDACGSISSLGQMELPDNSPFFVDNYREREGSPYYVPFCPANLSTWCGSKYYKGHSKKFYKTEKVMVDFINRLNSSSDPDFVEHGRLSTTFHYKKPMEFYSDKEGSILREIYKVDVNLSTLTPPPGGGYYNPENVSLVKGEIGYPIGSGSLSKGQIISFRLTTAKGINPSDTGYAYVYKVDGSTAYLDLLHYGSPLVSQYSTYTVRRLWKFWNKITVVNPQNFWFTFSHNIKKDTSLLVKVLNTYEKVYIDNVLHYLDRIQLPDNYTKISIAKMKEVKNAFNRYRKGEISVSSLVTAINTRKIWLYDLSSGSKSTRAQQIHDHMRNSDIFEKTYGTLNNRINKRTGTLRELIKYAFNTSVADSITDLKRESITSYGDTLVVYPLTRSTNGTKGIEIQLEKDETIESFYEYVKWMSEVYIISDNVKLPFFKTRIMDIEERGESALALTLFDSIPEETVYSTDDNARLVRIF